uniref:Corticotropin-releasing factor-binding protein n=1 Tax=Hippocampus comes TaxID=109280 RepID=A0A3Q2XG87_HIPCM
MSPSVRTELLFLFLSLSSRTVLSRYIEVRSTSPKPAYVVPDSQTCTFRRTIPQTDYILFSTWRCLDMLAIEGHFTFVASSPQQLSCAAFIIGEPSEVIGLELSDVNIDCDVGDFIKIFDGWVLKGEKFPSSQDHPLPLHQRYTDICSSTPPSHASRSSQNVAMVFFRIHNPDSGFTLVVKKLPNPFPCNIMSQSPEGSFTMVMPHQHRNCSFSIIYPVEIQLAQLKLTCMFNTVGCLFVTSAECTVCMNVQLLMGLRHMCFIPLDILANRLIFSLRGIHLKPAQR